MLEVIKQVSSQLWPYLFSRQPDSVERDDMVPLSNIWFLGIRSESRRELQPDIFSLRLMLTRWTHLSGG